LSGWIGLSRIRELPAWQAAYDLLLAGAALAWLLALVRSVKRRYREIEPPIARAAVAGGFLWLTGVWLIASAWDATYEKFWIGGVIAAVIVLALVGEAYLAKREAGSPGPVRSLIANAVAVPLALLLLLSLSAGAVPRRFSRNVGLATAQQLASHVGSGDLLVAAGWDAPSVYLKLLVSPDVQVFSFVDEAVRVGRDPERTLEALAAAVRAAHERQGTVYFLGLLDVTRIDWEWFFGRRLGIPHAVLDEYRLGAEPVAMLAAPGGILALKRLVF
jgi:hypothetical protein